MYEVKKRYLQSLKVENIEAVLPDPKGPNAIPPRPDVKMQIEQMKTQERQMNHQLRFKLGLAKLMQETELIQAKITELQAKAVLELEQADGVKNGHAIAMIEAEIGARKAQMDGVMRSIELMRDIEREANDGSRMEGMVEPSSNRGVQNTPQIG
jgi:hypothetical protein